ncbi:Uncharacterised protein [Mycobacterium tuberculosis]|uniref:Uncharacterized protein n=1 Tax=Mycobacterium tuberculosis TaxID=1773 RepID=A0A655JHI1_MYCTX|nr:Uncharacterised protein [Mycobacterium tuberculosis]CFE72137.1 Uncharacterised protein [Mycobacterium tuberculosis]COW58025.1 Uncharacterised protein [Mycobacterium tuberculosis]COW93913.1 Uncharacterised protein [Mycobacterium tuberculosis]
MVDMTGGTVDCTTKRHPDPQRTAPAPALQVSVSAVGQ